MKQELAAALIQLAEGYSKATGLRESTIGKNFAGDGRFFSHVRNGGGFGIDKFDMLVSRFAENWPEGAEWPEAVKRPQPHPEAAE